MVKIRKVWANTEKIAFLVSKSVLIAFMNAPSSSQNVTTRLSSNPCRFDCRVSEVARDSVPFHHHFSISASITAPLFYDVIQLCVNFFLEDCFHTFYNY